jgi:hypothetical protein
MIANVLQHFCFPETTLTMNYRDNTSQKRFSVFIGVILIASMLMSLFIPLLRNPTTQTVEPTTVPTVTPPPPIADLSTIAFDRTYLHPTGLFTLKMPTGWNAASSTSTSQEAQVTLSNPTQASVIEVRLLKPSGPVATTAELGQIFNEEWLKSSWREYQTWDESRRDVVDNTIQIDFTLTRNDQNFIARQIARSEGDWVYITRVVTPSNGSDMLRYVLTETDKTIQLQPVAADIPLEWSSYSDAAWQHLIRFPASWQNVDGTPGVPASFQGPDGVLRIEAVNGAKVASAEDAEAYAKSTRTGLTVQNVKPVTHTGGDGFQVAYTVTTLEGETESGAMVLINGADEKLHVATLRLTNPVNVNLNDDAAATTYADALKVLNSFEVYAGKDVSVSL